MFSFGCKHFPAPGREFGISSLFIKFSPSLGKVRQNSPAISWRKPRAGGRAAESRPKAGEHWHCIWCRSCWHLAAATLASAAPARSPLENPRHGHQLLRPTLFPAGMPGTRSPACPVTAAHLGLKTACMTSAITLLSFSVREVGQKGLTLQETRCPLPKAAAARCDAHKDAHQLSPRVNRLTGAGD